MQETDERVVEGCYCCYQVNVLTAAVVGGTTDVENFDLESRASARAKEKGGRGMRAAAAEREM